MSEWSCISSQNPPHHKPPSESGLPALDEERETIVSFHCLQRLDSCGEEGNPPPPLSGTPSPPSSPTESVEDSTSTSVFGNSLSVLGVPYHSGSADQNSPSSPISFPPPTFSSHDNSASVIRDSERLDSGYGSLPAIVNNNSNSNNNNSNNNTNSRLVSTIILNSRKQSEVTSGNNDNVINSGCLSPTSNTDAPAFPSEPTVLANKFIILGQVDSSTSHAVRIGNHEPVHIKAVSARTAREVCTQQALLDETDGVRAPSEAVISPCGKRAWLVFPPHFGDLHSYVRLRRRLREAEAQRLFAQVAATVERCHTSGLVLRDLKLRKFVFTDSNRQRVVLESVEDSVVAGESDLLHDKHGCPAYVAPEILTASTYSGRYADMWGLGVILYTMLVGRYPFHNADTTTLFARIRSGKFCIPDWVSSRARHLILSLLRRQPHRRLTARQVLLHPWLNRCPRDHVGNHPQDHIVPTNEPMTQHTLTPGKPRPP